MKKIIATLLLLVFTTNIASFAGEVIVIGSDGQAKYEDESRNIPVSQKVIESTKQKNILNEVTITDETGKRESIYIDYRGNVKKIENAQITQTEQINVDKTKEANYQRIINNAPKTLYNADSILSQYGYGKKDNSSKSNKEYMKMNLLDGDYVIGYKDAPYIAEYHKDGTLMGLAKVEKKELNDKKGSVVFYEYRVGYNTSTGMGLKHVLFLDFEKYKYISQYIYKHDGKLLCRQMNNDIYVASEARNMIPDWSKKTTMKAVVYNRNNSKDKEEILDAVTTVAGAPFVVTGRIIKSVAIVTTAPIWIPLLWWFFNKCDWTH